MSNYTSNDIINAIAAAAKALEARKDEINRLNVFPVPDGDTGTNMSLTLAMVVDNLAKLPIGASSEDRRRAITTGALMGARGNSGVITSQIMRGLCEGIADHEEFDIVAVDDAFSRAVEVAFNAVRKPVEGTILTVLRDTATAAHKARKKKMELDEGLQFIVGESYASVQRTPELLPVLKENGVVDAGGFGIAIFFDSFVASLTGRAEAMVDELAFARTAAPKVEIEQINDWEGSEFTYCNEFLVDSDVLDKAEALDFLATMGDCELCVGEVPKFKVHVHSDHPDQVLKYFLDHGQISEVFIHNMQIQSAERTEKLAAEEQAERKPLGFVAVAAGEGLKAVFGDLGVDAVVSGGQTMNPSTEDILAAIQSVPAKTVLVLPNNKNIIMASEQAQKLADRKVIVLPTRTVPQGMTAMLNFDPDLKPEENAVAMMQAADHVNTGLITYAARDSEFDGKPIKKGEIMALENGKIVATGTDLVKTTYRLARAMKKKDTQFITVISGCDVSDEDAEKTTDLVRAKCGGNIEVSHISGGQPVYYYMISVE